MFIEHNLPARKSYIITVQMHEGTYKRYIPGATRTAGGEELMYARQKLVTVCKYFKLQAIDMVHIDYKGEFSVLYLTILHCIVILVRFGWVEGILYARF